jgi:mannose-6-phosphate isomerase-like protein (cupin superfamily)
MVEREEYSVELERIPPGGGSELHSHRLSRQFFFVLEGAARMHVAGKAYTLSPREGMDVDPGTSHRIEHVAGEALVFLLVSVPRLSPNDVEPG